MNKKQSKFIEFLFVCKKFSNAASDIVVDDLPSRGRQGRQQNGDTYTLEIAFPAVKYVVLLHLVFQKRNALVGYRREMHDFFFFFLLIKAYGIMVI